MGVVYGPESNFVKEMAKWNKPYTYQEFPRMLYRATETPNGALLVFDHRDTPDAHAFNLGNQKIVNDEAELERALSQEWTTGPAEAVEKARQAAKGISTAEAERFAAEARMSEKAQREAQARDAALSDGSHLGELPAEKTVKPTETVQCSSKTKAGKQCKFKALEGARFCRKHSD